MKQKIRLPEPKEDSIKVYFQRLKRADKLKEFRKALEER